MSLSFPSLKLCFLTQEPLKYDATIIPGVSFTGVLVTTALNEHAAWILCKKGDEMRGAFGIDTPI